MAFSDSGVESVGDVPGNVPKRLRRNPGAKVDSGFTETFGSLIDPLSW